MILSYILIVILIAAVALLYKKVLKLESSQLKIHEKPNGELVITYAKEEIYNYKLEKK